MITNAIKFTATGYVKLRASYERHEDTAKVVAIVEDTGIGIDGDTLERLFKPFVQADQSTTRIYGGSGLGLSIARKMAQSMGGDVTLESVKGKGTKAIITLKLQFPSESARNNLTGSRTASDKSTHSQQDGQVQQRSGKAAEDVRILLVEDNLVNKKVVQAHLDKLGFRRIDWVRNGAEAVEYMRNAMRDDAASSPAADLPARPDIILMDCQMPVLDGYDATRKLRDELEFEGPIVALTASAIEGDRQKCIDAGMVSFAVMIAL